MIISGITENRIARFAGEIKGQELVIVSSPARAGRMADDLSFFADKKVLVLPDAVNEDFKYEAKSLESSFKTLMVLSEMQKSEDLIVVAPVLSALQPLPPVSAFLKDHLYIDSKSLIEREELIRMLVDMGYAREEICEAEGQFAVRGDIIDIYAVGSDYPVRIELFDNEIDSLRVYDPYSQRSIKTADFADVYPARLEGGEGRLWDYLKEGAKILIDDPGRMAEDLAAFEDEKAETLPEADYYFYPLDHPDADLHIETRQAPVYSGHMDVFADDMRSFLRRGYEVTVACSSQERLINLKDYLAGQKIEGIILKDGRISAGTEFVDDKKLYLSDSDIFPYTKVRRRLRKSENTQKIKAFTDIKKGDYVVHEAYGVGKFAGVRKMSVSDSTKDYLRIEYAGNDVLYVPVDQMSSIQKYVGSESVAPRINKLAGSDWAKTKERVKAAVKDMAADFLKAAAERQASPGFAFAKDSVWQREFEESFPFEETADQLKAAEEIKEDMQSPFAMDRLLCGDVGYGKTEVAARAVFKCLEQGKQAAILVPTTILANQHYHSFISRMSAYPFNIEMISRFRTAKQQKEIAEKVKKGEVDLLIGTHRLLSDDIEFKDLGLLVIDEEQRFGVEHKEKIKKLKTNVDVLTLSATPIPRTLHMSLTGIRNMSLITEPPENRYPVQTYVMEEDDELIASSIKRELERGGQVYVVYNRVNGIHTVAKKIQELVPGATVAVGHGRMGETSLEDVMMDFSAGKYQVLVATTIIESGLDIPNVNTMIILDSDRYGLSQLYQLRGRVGRTNRIAYCFLMYKKDKQLSEEAEKRLKAIREFTEFGSGFRIAMRDLEIRGAGNVLGVEQSGHMLAVGYELYCKLVDEAVRELKAEQSGEEIAESYETNTEVNLGSTAYIPEEYIADEMLRLDIYKHISLIETVDDRIELTDELIDRFGDLPRPVENLMDISMIHNRAGRLGINCVVKQRGELIFVFEEKNGLTAEMVSKLIDCYDLRLTVYSGKQSRLSLVLDKAPAAQEALNMLDLMV